MTTQEITQLPLGTKVYLINNHKILQYTTLCFHVKYNDSFFFLTNSLNESETKCLYLKGGSDTNLIWETDYNKAKQIMWQQLSDNVKSINDIYFNEDKSINIKQLHELLTVYLDNEIEIDKLNDPNNFAETESDKALDSSSLMNIILDKNSLYYKNLEIVEMLSKVILIKFD